MERIRLVIKGSPRYAFESAARHGIEITDVEERKNWNETVAYCAERYEKEVGEWFIEDLGLDHFALGSLLFYRSVCIQSVGSI